jgi:AbrB family looped-hinge helix DNA binding protein
MTDPTRQLAGKEPVTLVKVIRNGQITLPAEARKALRLNEGDYLEAEVVDGEVRLKPVTVIDRKEAWRKIRKAQASVRYIGPEPRPSPEEEERQIFDIVEDFRGRHA